MTRQMDDQMDGRMDDGTDGWNDASRRPLLYVITVVQFFKCVKDPSFQFLLKFQKQRTIKLPILWRKSETQNNQFPRPP